MEEEKEILAEDRILAAAIEEFIATGYDATRMQSIADRAGISKSALHYYFRSKERLFKEVLENTVGDVIKELSFELSDADSFGEKLERGMRKYYRAISKDVKMVRFLFMEVNRNPELINRFLENGKNQIWLANLDEELMQEYEAGRINKISAEQLIINLISMCTYPQIAGNLISKAFAKTPEQYEQLIIEREETVIQFITNALIKR
jgi:AcrR family transcriptional regulator